MALSRKLFHVSMIVDASVLHEITTAAARGKASNVQIEPVQDRRQNEQEEADNKPRIPAKTVLTPWWAKHKTFTMKEALLFGVEHGYQKGAIYTATLTAMKLGWVERTASGAYKVLPAMKKAAKTLNGANGAAPPTKIERSKPDHHAVVHTDFVLQQIAKGVVTYKTLREAFEADGRKKRSVDGALGKLKQIKQIANDGHAQYKLLAKGSEHLKSLT